jgi:DNA polymerase sigma
MHVHLVLQTMVNCKQLHIGLQEFFHFWVNAFFYSSVNKQT